MVEIGGPDPPVVCEDTALPQPLLGVVGVTGDARQTYLYELRPQPVSIGEVSPSGLAEAIRAAALRRPRAVSRRPNGPPPPHTGE